MTDPDSCAAPREVSTPRLVLSSWHPADAAELLPILQANWDHLSPWIPARVATPVPLPELAERLTDYAANFSHNKEWRYAIRLSETGQLLGEVAMFPRAADGRVRFEQSDRVELGYWLRADLNGRGLATEAAGALLQVAQSISRFGQIEIRCDPDNARSAAIPRRLGFTVLPSGDPRTVLFCLNNAGSVKSPSL